MKLYRKDGSEVELSEEDAAKWLKQSLGFLTNPKEPAQPAVKQSWRGKVADALTPDSIKGE